MLSKEGCAFRADLEESTKQCKQLEEAKEALAHQLDSLQGSYEQLTITRDQLEAELQEVQAALQACEAAKAEAEVRVV